MCFESPHFEHISLFDVLGLDQIISCREELDGCVHLNTSSDLLICTCVNVVSACSWLVGGLLFDASSGSLELFGCHLQLVLCA